MGTRKRVLVVDDEPGILRFVGTALNLRGYEVTVTTSGEEALRLVKSIMPDIMLLDIFMAPVSEFDVLERLRAFSGIPVIVFTARSSAADRARALGACDCIAKPFRPDELVRKIRETLDRHAQNSEG